MVSLISKECYYWLLNGIQNYCDVIVFRFSYLGFQSFIVELERREVFVVFVIRCFIVEVFVEELGVFCIVVSRSNGEIYF